MFFSDKFPKAFKAAPRNQTVKEALFSAKNRMRRSSRFLFRFLFGIQKRKRGTEGCPEYTDIEIKKSKNSQVPNFFDRLNCA